MDDQEFEQRVGGLDSLLDELIALLRQAGEMRWPVWAEHCRGKLRDRDRSAFDALLGAYGGMGSLNDLVLMRANGHTVLVEDEGSINGRLLDLRASIWEEATALRHSLR